ncbi:MAG: hypothetical protein JST30_11645 [Armatimonadetes bacterium]|nr:hypothetical protein [Armatimonadota bacterium]
MAVRAGIWPLAVTLFGVTITGCAPKNEASTDGQGPQARSMNGLPSQDGLVKTPAAPDFQKALVGTWSGTVSGRQVEVTFAPGREGHLDYRTKRGLPGFSDGYFEETGFAEIEKGRITWVPSELTDHPKDGSRTESARYRDWRKKMDEGAWKPFPPYITSIGASRLVLKDHLGQETAYRRLH